MGHRVKRVRFEEDLKEKGALYLFHELRTLKSIREYYQRWPLDDCPYIHELDQHVGDYYDENAIDPYEEAIQKSSDEEFFSQFNGIQLDVAVMTAEGYKPREIAEMLNSTSGRIRMHKFYIKRKVGRHG